jgi:predicted acetyltransferase
VYPETPGPIYSHDMKSEHTFAPMAAEDMAAVSRIVAHCFTGTREDCGRWIEEAGPQHVRIMREADGGIAASLLRIPMGQYFGGRSVPLVGIAGVGVSPEGRGRGTAGALMAAALREMHEEGTPLSGLYAATQPLYRRVGYEQAGHRFEIRLPMTTLTVRDRAMAVRELTEQDHEAVRECYSHFAGCFDGPLDRGPYIWGRVCGTRDFKYTGFAATGESGEIEGYIYLVTRRKADRGRQEAVVSDLAFTTPRAGRRLLALLGDFGSMADEAIMFGGPMHPALFLLNEQRFRIDLRDHWMLRVVNVVSALESRGYRRHIAAGLVLDVRDDLIADNTGRWRLEVEAGRGRSGRGGDGPALSLDVQSLAALYSGYLSATQLRLLGRAEGDEVAIAAADAIFAGTTPWMSDMY